MNGFTESDIHNAIKKHVPFAIFLALVPIIFIQSISYFSGEDQLTGLLVFIAPISIIGACAHFMKSVLIDLNLKRLSNT